MKWQWVVWTDRPNETPRKGYGDANLGTTLRHLANRGDGHCKLQAEHDDTGTWPPIVDVDLAEHRTLR